MNSNLIKCAVATRQMAGETVSGDAHPTKPTEKGFLAVVAGRLDCVRQATEAARLAVAMAWLGAGNVGELLVRSPRGGHRIRESLALSPGIVGARIPLLSPTVLEVFPGNNLIFSTESIRPGFDHAFSFSRMPERTAQSILAQNSVETDDALVLVAGYRGRAKW